LALTSPTSGGRYSSLTDSATESKKFLLLWYEGNKFIYTFSKSHTRLRTYYLQRSATEHPSTCYFICCLHNLLNVLVQTANKMGLQERKIYIHFMFNSFRCTKINIYKKNCHQRFSKDFYNPFIHTKVNINDKHCHQSVKDITAGTKSRENGKTLNLTEFSENIFSLICPMIHSITLFAGNRTAKILSILNM
jgi:hypothetical protein